MANDDGYEALVDEFIVNSGEEKEKAAAKGSGIISGEEALRIHMKSLIKARQQRRQEIQFEQVQKRNKFFTKEILEKTSINMNNNTTNNNNINSVNSGERRRKILRTSFSSNEEEELIPCRLELDHDGYRVSDVFLLTASGKDQDLELISSQICLDYDLPGDPFQGAISRCLRDQVEEWNVFQGAMEGMPEIPFEEIGPVLLRLDIIVGLHRLEDQLEVSLDPEESSSANISRFVSALQSPDRGILSEVEYAAFKPLILHNLLEQLMLWRKSIVFGGFHRDARSNALKFHDGDVAVLLNDQSGLGSGSIRRHFAHTNTFTPILSSLTVEELEKIEAGRERENRRKRRTGTAAASGGVSSGKRTVNTTTTNAPNTTALVNNLIGTVRSPPRTLPTASSYRGSLHRLQTTAGMAASGANSDDEPSSAISGGGRKRGRKPKNYN